MRNVKRFCQTTLPANNLYKPYQPALSRFLLKMRLGRYVMSAVRIMQSSRDVLDRENIMIYYRDVVIGQLSVDTIMASKSCQTSFRNIHTEPPPLRS